MIKHLNIKQRSGILLFFYFIVSFSFTSSASADIGPRPSITIYVENFDSQNYLLDLLVPEGYIYFDFDDNGFNNHYPEDLKETALYQFEEDGWKAAHIRTSLLSGSLYGKYDDKTGLMVHDFGYAGTPSKFKIIVEKSDGNIIISESLKPKQFHADITFDMSTGEAGILKKSIAGQIKDQVLYNHNKGQDNFLLRVLLTIIIELLIAAFIFKIKKVKAIIFTNIVTQLILNIALFMMFYFSRNFFQTLILMESVVILLEYIIYLKFIHGVSKQKLFIYAFIANVVSFYVGLIIV